MGDCDVDGRRLLGGADRRDAHSVSQPRTVIVANAGRAMTDSASERMLMAGALRCLHHQWQDLDAHASCEARGSGRSVALTAHITRQRAIDQTTGLLANCRTRVVIRDNADSHPCALIGSTSEIPYPSRVCDGVNNELP